MVDGVGSRSKEVREIGGGECKLVLIWELVASTALMIYERKTKRRRCILLELGLESETDDDGHDGYDLLLLEGRDLITGECGFSDTSGGICMMLAFSMILICGWGLCRYGCGKLSSIGSASNSSHGVSIGSLQLPAVSSSAMRLYQRTFISPKVGINDRRPSFRTRYEKLGSNVARIEVAHILCLSRST